MERWKTKASNVVTASCGIQYKDYLVYIDSAKSHERLFGLKFSFDANLDGHIQLQVPLSLTVGTL